MGGKRQKTARDPEAQWVLTKRRVALGLYLLFLGTCLLGVQGPWWQVFVGERPVGDAVRGPDYRKTVLVAPEPTPEGEVVVADRLTDRYRREVEINTLRPAVLAALACVVAFFFASYDLVADADIQLPVLLATLVLAAIGGYVLREVLTDQEVIGEFIELQERIRLGSSPSLATTAAVTTTGDALAAPGGDAVRLRFEWGLALYLSSALVLLIDSIYMTFIAQRAAEKP